MALDRIFGEHSMVFIRSEQLFDWARARSLWYQSFGIACCSIEGLISASGPRFDFDRHGVFFRGVPRQSDVMIVAGTVNRKMAPVVRRLYEQMPEPRYVVSMGACANTGGPFREYPNVLLGVNEVIPVDIYVPGCPPRPESVQYAFLQLREKIYAQTDARLEARRRARAGLPPIDTADNAGECVPTSPSDATSVAPVADAGSADAADAQANSRDAAA
jgi:NADH-quinone oxidoreductase subunit B